MYLTLHIYGYREVKQASNLVENSFITIHRQSYIRFQRKFLIDAQRSAILGDGYNAIIFANEGNIIDSVIAKQGNINRT